MTLPKLLLFGANGQVGWELRRVLSPLGELIAVTRDGRYGSALDLSDLDAVQGLLNQVRPDIVVNAAAYTAVDQAEEERELAHRLNAGLPQLLAQWSSLNRVLVIHFSTDYVFDGRQSEPYTEESVPNPLSVYGESKLDGDVALFETAWNPFIFRVSWVYGARGRNFLLTMLRLMRERDRLTVVDDQWGAPTWCRDIAQVAAFCVQRVIHEPGFAEERSGLYHVSPGGEVSWCGFAREIGRIAGTSCRIDAIASADYPVKAERPRNSRMHAQKLQAAMGLRLPHWSYSLAACMEQMDFH